MKRPAYIERKIALERARSAARRTHAQPCRCPFCLTPAQVETMLAAVLARNASATEEAPF